MPHIVPDISGLTFQQGHRPPVSERPSPLLKEETNCDGNWNLVSIKSLVNIAIRFIAQSVAIRFIARSVAIRFIAQSIAIRFRTLGIAIIFNHWQLHKTENYALRFATNN